jgi:hypothetical protein
VTEQALRVAEGAAPAEAAGHSPPGLAAIACVRRAATKLLINGAHPAQT